jgi:hypothetical protein
MGNSQSTPVAQCSVIVEKGSGLDGDVRRNAKWPELFATGFEGEVATLYDGFQ